MSETAQTGGQSAESVNQFTIDLGQLELTDAEIQSFQNKLSQLAAESVQQAMRAAPALPAEPFVKILYVKQTFGKRIKA